MLPPKSFLLLQDHYRCVRMRYHMRKNQCFLVLSFVLTGVFFYYFGLDGSVSQQAKMSMLKDEESFHLNGFLVHTPGCKIPEMDPYDPSVRGYLQRNTFPTCNDILPLTKSNQTSIWIVPEALKYYNVTEASQLDCCYFEFRRVTTWSDSFMEDSDDSIQLAESCIQFNISADVPFEFVKVECFANGGLVYEDFHAFIIPKPKTTPEDKNGEVLDTGEESFQDISVLIVGADSLSRLNFYRQMPKTNNFLNYLGAIEFFGFNKVHDNTFPNLVPILSGYSVREISFCWMNHSSYFDNCPWIWKNFSSNNYVTAFAEDACWMGIFNYKRRGFKKPPTDYYARPFISTSEQIIGYRKILNTKFCIGHRFASEVLFEYASKFTLNMTGLNKKFWAFFWEASLTHDFLSVPSQTDDIFYEFFLKLHQGNVLNNTAVLFLSDHGMRFGGIRTTYQGRMEEHLPFFFVLIPDWFKERYSSAVKNLMRNTHLLTTPFDVHETMKDFMNLDSLKSDGLEAREQKVAGKRGTSLFLPVSIERTCESAGIQPTWCTCQQSKNVSTTDPLVQRAAQLTVDHINDLLKNYKECARLSLIKIMSAHMELEDERMQGANSRNSRSDYVVAIVTTPGLGEFESVVRHRLDSDKMTVASDVSRINLYGSQSQCVSDYRIKLYCFCK